jgi:tRNA A37 threonylcarbamoyladenosine dehydratase
MDKPVIVKESTDSEGVDTDLMSRIIPILGAGNLKKLMGLKVLISGISGLGAEIAKNLILTGLGVVTIHDTEKVDWIDLSSHVRIAPSPYRSLNNRFTKRHLHYAPRVL